jgi:predicted butyrate kinase (DUF1464 family)
MERKFTCNELEALESIPSKQLSNWQKNRLVTLRSIFSTMQTQDDLNIWLAFVYEMVIDGVISQPSIEEWKQRYTDPNYKLVANPTYRMEIHARDLVKGS